MLLFYRGEEEKTEQLTRELAELEEKADKLSKAKLSTTLSNISFINERNRRNNVERAEEAILEEIRVSGGQKAEDPFTRRSTKPRMMTNKASTDIPLLPGALPVALGIGKPIEPVASTVETKKQLEDKAKAMPKAKTGDLFSAHDFDIKIDLEVPLPCKLTCIILDVLQFIYLFLVLF